MDNELTHNGGMRIFVRIGPRKLEPMGMDKSRRVDSLDLETHRPSLPRLGQNSLTKRDGTNHLTTMLLTQAIVRYNEIL